MRRRSLLPLILVLCAASACRTADEGSPHGQDTGTVAGTVTIGPMCPVAQAGSPCPDLPWQGIVRLTDAAGAVVAETHSDPNGAFNIRVSAGTYAVTAVPGGVGPPTPSAERVTVRVGATSHVTLVLDSGIR